MKKRKPPLVLGTILVVMLVAVGIMNVPHGNASMDQMQPPPPQANENAPRPTITPSQIAQMSPRPTKSKLSAMEAPGGPGSGKASIAVPKYTPYKPKPNDSSTSTQWYTDQTQK